VCPRENVMTTKSVVHETSASFDANQKIKRETAKNINNFVDKMKFQKGASSLFFYLLARDAGRRDRFIKIGRIRIVFICWNWVGIQAWIYS